MKDSLKKFLLPSSKKITLMGMSGVGKTYLSMKLSEWGWDHYSCDYEIGANFLRQEIQDCGFLNPVTIDDLSSLSAFVGKLGNQAEGGIDLLEFQRRQKLYYDAECKSLLTATKKAQNASGNFVNDSTGSFCEILDSDLLKKICQQTLLVYIKATDEEEKEVLKRAQDYPKPMFFPPDMFLTWLEEYLEKNNISAADEIIPDNFSRWVFPILFEKRLPKYQQLADQYGITISSSDFKGIESEDSFYATLLTEIESKEDQIAYG